MDKDGNMDSLGYKKGVSRMNWTNEKRREDISVDFFVVRMSPTLYVGISQCLGS